MYDIDRREHQIITYQIEVRSKVYKRHNTRLRAGGGGGGGT